MLCPRRSEQPVVDFVGEMRITGCDTRRRVREKVRVANYCSGLRQERNIKRSIVGGFLERQLHIAILVIVVIVVAVIMHVEKIEKSELWTLKAVLGKMREQNRQLEQSVERTVQQENRQ